MTESTDEKCTQKNPYHDEWLAAITKFHKQYGLLGEKLLTKEERKESEQTGATRIYTMPDVEEYKEISDKYMEEEIKRSKYQESCKKEALQLFVKYFDGLWW